MDRNTTTSELGAENISDRFSDEFSGKDVAIRHEVKKPEAVIRNNKAFTDEFDIPLRVEEINIEVRSNTDNEAVTQAKDISTNSRPTQIIKNPRDNIRYVSRKEEAKKEKKKAKAEFPAKNEGKSGNIYDEIKLMINSRDTEAAESNFSLFDIDKFKEDIKARKEEYKKRKRGGHRRSIDIKSTSDIDFFSMTSDESENNSVESLRIHDESDDDKGIKKLFSGNSEEARSHIEDYEKSEDAESMFSDMNDLQTNLHSRIIALLVLTVMSVYVVLANNLDKPIFSVLDSSVSPQGFIFIQLIMGIVAMAVSFTTILGGLKKIISKNPDCDSMTAVVLISSLIAGIMMLTNTRLVAQGMLHIYIPIGIASLLFNTIGKYLIVDRAICNFCTVSDSSREMYAMFCVDDEDRAERISRDLIDDYPVVAASRKTDFLADFLKYTYSTDIADRFCRYAVPIFSAISLLCALLLPLINIDKYSGSMVQACFSVFSMSMSFCSCFALSIIVNLPLNSISKEYSETSGLMLGYQSVEDFYDANVIMADTRMIFPENTITLGGIKSIAETPVDEAIINAGSIAIAGKSILSGMFMTIVDGKTEMFRKVENCEYEENKGLCGWINNKRVLFGNRELMSAHHIERMITEDEERKFTEKGYEVMYLSVSGNLSAVFAIYLRANPEIKYWLSEMQECGIKMAVRNDEAIINDDNISKKFNIPKECFKILEKKYEEDFSAETKESPRTSASMAHEGDLSTIIKLISDSKNLRRNFVAGIIIQTAAAILGILFAIIFVCMDSVQDVNPTMIMIYNLAWTAITAFLVKSRIF